jgi:hypothetical protein
MVLVKSLFTDTIKRLKNERKRLFAEIQQQTVFVNTQNKIDRREFLRRAKTIIYTNFHGVSLEPNERVMGKRPDEFVVVKAKPDSIGKSCPISIRLHSKNSIYFVISPSKQSVVVKCFKCPGFVELFETSNIYGDMKANIVVSEKEQKKCKTTRYQRLENLDAISIVKFDHSVINVDSDVIMEFYTANSFVLLPCRLDRKSPINTDWVSRTFEMNETVNFKFNNIGILCGAKSGIFVVDIDINDNGLTYFQQLCSKHNYRYDISTTCILTPSGGIHLYYRYNDSFSSNSVRMKTQDDKPIGIDIRSNGGCVIVRIAVFFTQGGQRAAGWKKKPPARVLNRINSPGTTECVCKGEICFSMHEKTPRMSNFPVRIDVRGEKN